MSHFLRLICFLCSTVTKILFYRIFKSLNSVLIYILHSVTTFMELGFYNETKKQSQKGTERP